MSGTWFLTNCLRCLHYWWLVWVWCSSSMQSHCRLTGFWVDKTGSRCPVSPQLLHLPTYWVPFEVLAVFGQFEAQCPFCLHFRHGFHGMLDWFGTLGGCTGNTLGARGGWLWSNPKCSLRFVSIMFSSIFSKSSFGWSIVTALMLDCFPVSYSKSFFRASYFL